MNANNSRSPTGVVGKNFGGGLHHAVTAGKLRRVEGDIGALEHAIDRILRLPATHAKTAGDLEAAVWTLELQIFHPRAQSIGGAHGALDRLALQHESKLFSTQPANDGGFASGGLRYGAQYFVTDVMAVDVVDLLEMVDVHHNRRHVGWRRRH